MVDLAWGHTLFALLLFLCLHAQNVNVGESFGIYLEPRGKLEDGNHSQRTVAEKVIRNLDH